MRIDEVLTLLNKNGYLTELTLKYKNLDREEHAKSDIHSNLGINYPRPKPYYNDGRPFYIAGNTTVTNYSLHTFADVKELLFFTRNTQEIYKREIDLLNTVMEFPEDYSIAFNNATRRYKLSKSELLDMITVALEDKSNEQIDSAFNVLLNSYLIEFYKVINAVASGARPIYRGIGLPEAANLKTHRNLGTSWSISKGCAGTFAEISTTEPKARNLAPYIITAKVKTRTTLIFLPLCLTGGNLVENLKTFILQMNKKLE